MASRAVDGALVVVLRHDGGLSLSCSRCRWSVWSVHAALVPDRPLSITPDGGRTWTQAPLPKTRAGWRYVGARSATALVTLADPPAPVLWTSSTAGRTWTPHPIR